MSKILLVALIMSITLAAQPAFGQEWVVKSKGKNPQILWQDGLVTRGDPKTTYDQSENEAHRYKLDISKWTIGSQGSSHDAYTVTYLSPEKGTGDQVIVTYNLLEGSAISAVRQTNTVVKEIPDLDGLTNVWGERFIKGDGTGVELYANQDKTKTVTLQYDASGNFVQGTVYNQEKLSPQQVKLSPYCTELYGCTQ